LSKNESPIIDAYHILWLYLKTLNKKWNVFDFGYIEIICTSPKVLISNGYRKPKFEFIKFELILKLFLHVPNFNIEAIEIGPMHQFRQKWLQKKAILLQVIVRMVALEWRR